MNRFKPNRAQRREMGRKRRKAGVTLRTGVDARLSKYTVIDKDGRDVTAERVRVRDDN